MERPVKVLFFLDGVGNGGGIQEMVIRWMQHIDRSRVAADLLAFRFGPLEVLHCGGDSVDQLVALLDGQPLLNTAPHEEPTRFLTGASGVPGPDSYR